MAILKSSVNRDDNFYAKNYQNMAAIVDQLQTYVETIKLGGGAKSHKKQQEKGKQPVRTRIQALLDHDSEFLEIGQFAAWDVYTEIYPLRGGCGRYRAGRRD